MDKQIKYLIGVLAAIIISAYFLSLLSGIPNFIKDDIIAFLEAETEGEISFGKLSLWPLNRINVKNFKFKDRYGNNYAAEELSLDYSLNILQDAEIISVEFVELKDSLIEINQLSQRTEAEALNADQMPSELLQNGSDDNSDNLESNKKTER